MKLRKFLSAAFKSFMCMVALNLSAFGGEYLELGDADNPSNDATWNPFADSPPAHRLPYFCNDSTLPKNKQIEVLLLGQTGSGKSTFLNMAANYFRHGVFTTEQQDVKIVIPTRYFQAKDLDVVHSEKNVRDQSKSQTTKPISYQFDLSEKSPGSSFTFIDTPGLGDTEGIQQDDVNQKRILRFAAKRGKKLSGIVLFFNGTDPRATATKLYTLTKLKGMLPDSALNSMVVVLTNTYSGASTFPVKQLTRLGISEDRIFYMNNSVFATDPKAWNRRTVERLASDWDDSIMTMDKIVRMLATDQVDLGKDFKRMVKIRDQIMQELHSVRLNFAEIQEAQSAIAEYSAKFKSQSMQEAHFKDYAKKATIKTRKFVADPKRHYSTVCSKHNVTCHDKCSLDETIEQGNKILAGCMCLKKYAGKHCETCSGSGHCDYKSHYHARGLFKMVEETLQDRLEEYKKQYEAAKSETKNAKEELNSAESALSQIKDTIAQFSVEVKEKLAELKSICRGYNFVAELNATIRLLEQESYRYTSSEAMESSQAFINQMKIMAEELTDKGFDEDSTSKTSASDRLGLQDGKRGGTIFSRFLRKKAGS